MKRIKVISYSRTSMSAKAIARYQRGKNRIRPDGAFRGQRDDIIINWGYHGSITNNVIGSAELINQPSSIANASSKVDCLRILEDNDVPTLEFYTNKSDLEEALFGESEELESKVYCRTLTRSHSGKGIELATTKSEIVRAPLYTIDFPNDIEYRIHIFKGNVIDIQQKRRMTSERRERLGIDRVVDDIRNRDNGWSFTRDNITLKDSNGDWISQLYEISMNAMDALSLDFGAIDILYNSEDNEAIICEVNTAAGQKVGTTTNYRYIKAIHEYAGNDISLNAYNRRWGSELTEFNNGMVEYLDYCKNR